METSDLIIVTGVVVGGSSLIRDIKQDKPKAPVIIFTFFMVAGLLLISLPLPKVSRGLAYLSLVGAFVVNGPALFGTATSLTASSKKATGTTQAPGTTTAGGRG